MSQAAIMVRGLGKRYRIRERAPYKVLRDVMGAALTAPFRRWRGPRASEAVDIWALRDISFEVQPGEVLGVIGSNGSGKTTLLKILSRITDPTEGSAEVYGRVGSMLEVGTGFHPELTGRENIALNGAILGMRRAEITRKFDQIVAFSGVEPFIDTPVKHYSSGMYVRLAFSVAAHFDSEILLVDEVLAVGDAVFQERCLGKMSEVVRGGRTILFVSHNMTAVRNLCSRALLLEKGRIQLLGSVHEAIQAYLSGCQHESQPRTTSLAERTDRFGDGTVRAISFEARTAGRVGFAPTTSGDAEFIVGFASADGKPIFRLQVVIGVTAMDGTNLFGCTTRNTPLGYFWNAPSTGKAVCRVRQLPLMPGEYTVRIWLKNEQGLADRVEEAARFTVIDAGESGMDLSHSRAMGPTVVQHTWGWLSEPEAVSSGGGEQALASDIKVPRG